MAFLNTLDVDEGTDELATTAQWVTWLSAHELAASFPEPDDAGLEQARALRHDLRARAGGERCAEVRSVGIQVALTADGAVELSATSPVGLVAAAVAKVGHRATARPGQDLPRRRLPVGVLRHLTQPLAAVVLDGDLREPGQGPLAPRAGHGSRGVGPRAPGARGWPRALGSGAADRPGWYDGPGQPVAPATSRARATAAASGRSAPRVVSAPWPG